MSFTYAIPDLHGRFDLFGGGLHAIVDYHCKHDAGRTRAKVIGLGDAIDRGPDSSKILRFQMQDDDVLDTDFVWLKGNHCDMMVQCLRGKKRLDWWLGNGGYQTIASFGGTDRDTSCIPEEVIDFVDRLPLYHEDEHRVYVHAAVDPKMPMDGQNKQTLLWECYGRTDPGGWRWKHVVHGHEQFEDGPILLPSRTNLDTKAWRTGRLVIGVFDDDQPGGPIDLIEVKGRPYSLALGDYE